MEQLIKYQLGQVSFPQYEQYLALAHEIATVLDTMPLNEDNIKEVKRSLADARKVVDALNQRRIEVKKALLEPYNTLEAQVKVITGVIDEADGKLRVKVREMEEAERELKKGDLRGIWELRSRQYQFPAYMPTAFDIWLRPWHLNKTTPLSKSEAEMTEWMEQADKDLAVINALEPEFRTLVMDEFTSSADLGAAMAAAQARIARRQAIPQAPTNAEVTATFIITGDKDITLTEMLLNTNKINYRKA